MWHDFAVSPDSGMRRDGHSFAHGDKAHQIVKAPITIGSILGHNESRHNRGNAVCHLALRVKVKRFRHIKIEVNETERRIRNFELWL